MRILKKLFAVIASILLSASISAAAQAPVSLNLQSDAKNPATPVMGDHMRFWSTISNTGSSPIEGLVAWISLVEIDPGNEQPVDLEDWSAHKAVTGASLKPGESLQTDWPMRLIKGGDYRVVVSVTDPGSNTVFTSPTLQFHVRQKSVLQAGRVLPVAAAIPLLICALMIFNKTTQRLRRERV
ncbi:hypothetical protein SAMN02746041_03187 [Desulfacinum hydrothermale DSM 13146]|uniref:Uncharacterized protein n=1 Tax=Desulfacinum hydrothermale DSM 13146 TaxID=1121390 RepID=A0A1W1XWC7_9BACT|nr:hypothetical protein [Desulfacinum hydrothermale]SMC28144.1 hypothetical protein SAMN02746041_03187 [Desulfacinum hydrothermale DSM 13146]